MVSPTHCQKTLEMQIPKAVAEKAVGLCGENPEPLPLLAPARALWACKPHPPQQGTLGSRKPGSLSAVGSHPAMCYLCLSDAESTNLQWLCSKGRSRKPGPQHCFLDMSSDGGEPWKQERSSLVPHFKVTYLSASLGSTLSRDSLREGKHKPEPTTTLVHRTNH